MRLTKQAGKISSRHMHLKACTTVGKQGSLQFQVCTGSNIHGMESMMDSMQGWNRPNAQVQASVVG